MSIRAFENVTADTVILQYFKDHGILAETTVHGCQVRELAPSSPQFLAPYNHQLLVRFTTGGMICRLSGTNPRDGVVRVKGTMPQRIGRLVRIKVGFCEAVDASRAGMSLLLEGTTGRFELLMPTRGRMPLQLQILNLPRLVLG